MRFELKLIILWFMAVIALLTTNACDRTTDKHEVRVFNGKPAKLAVIPAGFDLGETTFSVDGRHVVFAATKSGTAIVIADGNMNGPYEYARDLVYQQDTDGFAFVAGVDGKESVVVNGREGRKFEGVGKPSFAPDGLVICEVHQDGKWRIIAGKRESPAYAAPSAPPIITPDGKTLVYVEMRSAGNTSHVRACTLDLRDCISGKDYDLVRDMKTDPSGSHLAYITAAQGNMAVVTADLSSPVLMEREGPWYDEIHSVAVAEGGRHLAYVARRDNDHFLVKDGVETPAPRPASPLVISKQGRTFYVGVAPGRFFAVVDGKRTGRAYHEMDMPAFSPDGTRVAYVARYDKTWSVIVNDREGPAFDRVVDPQFTPDGAHLIYRARRQGERFVVVADSRGGTVREQPHYEAVWKQVMSPDEKFIGYGVRKGRELWWQVEPVGPSTPQGGLKPKEPEQRRQQH